MTAFRRGILLLLLAAVSACSLDSAPAPSTVSDRRLHAVMTESLDLELARLDTLTFDLHRTPTELDRERARRLEDIARAAQRLRDSAIRIRNLAPTLSLGDYERERFDLLATQLAEQAEALSAAAHHNRLERLTTQMAQIRRTCDSCHSLYRGP